MGTFLSMWKPASLLVDIAVRDSQAQRAVAHSKGIFTLVLKRLTLAFVWKTLNLVRPRFEPFHCSFPDFLAPGQRQLEQVGIGALPLNPEMQKELDKSFSDWILETAKPFSLSEEPQFIQFLKLLNPRYKLPNRRLTKEMV
jgi:hypothetical protein